MTGLGRGTRRTAAPAGVRLERTLDEYLSSMFRDRIKDANGHEVHMFWDAASYESPLLPPSPPGGN